MLKTDDPPIKKAINHSILVHSTKFSLASILPHPDLVQFHLAKA